MNAPWMQFLDGRPWNLDVEVGADEKRFPLDAAQLGHVLSNINRFTGHTLRPYTVAQHSVLVSRFVRDQGHSVPTQLYALLHDAHECVTGDVSAPLKLLLRSDKLKWLEGRMDRLIFEAFGLPPVPGEWTSYAVKIADLALLNTERRDLLAPCVRAWQLDMPEPLKRAIRPWSPRRAAATFAKTASELQAKL